MNVKWLNLNLNKGQVSLYKNYLTLNKNISNNFNNVEFVQVGLSEDGNIIIKPINATLKNKLSYDKQSFYPLKTHISYSRVASTQLMDLIAKGLNLSLSNKPLIFEAIFDENEHYLIVKVKKEKKEND